MALVAPYSHDPSFLSVVSLGAIQYQLTLSHESTALILFGCVLIGAAGVSRGILK